MKKIILVILYLVLLTNCGSKNDNCFVEFSNNIIYDGYGIIKFNNCHTGSIRYIEFYPICNLDKEQLDNIKFSSNNISKGIVIRETSTSDLWYKLINDKKIIFDKDNYGIALVYLSFKNRTDISKEKTEFTNYILINGQELKVQMIDLGLYNINTKKINIIRGL
jgi:hypothetical protein